MVELSLPAGCEHAQRGIDFLSEPSDETGDEVEGPKDEAGAQVAGGGAADHALRYIERYRKELRGALRECVGGEPHLRGDRSAEEGAVLRDEVERHGCAEVDDEERPSVQRVAGDAVDDAIRADRPGLVDVKADRRRARVDPKDLAIMEQRVQPGGERRIRG